MISQDLKKGILLLLSLAALNSTVYADVIWPGTFLFAGVSSLIGILAGFAVELFFVKYFAKTKWSKAIAVTFIMNLVSIWGVRLVLAFTLTGRVGKLFGITSGEGIIGKIFGKNYGLKGIWIAMCLELCFRGTIFLIRFIRKKWIPNIKKEDL